MHEEEESNALVKSRMSFVPEWIPYLTVQYSMPTTANSCSCSYPSFPVSYLSYHPSPKFSICMYSVIYLPSLPPNPPQLIQSNPIINPQRKNQSQLPSLQPVLHLSSHLSQSNFCFPNFPFTALCASHIHLPNSSRLLTRGAFAALFSLIHARKSSAQTPHGYNFPNRWRNCRVSVCCEGVGCRG